MNFVKRKNRDGFTQYQCPLCKKWFVSYLKYCKNNSGVKHHITLLAKTEAISKIEEKPHLKFYLENTNTEQIIKRIWK